MLKENHIHRIAVKRMTKFDFQRQFLISEFIFCFCYWHLLINSILKPLGFLKMMINLWWLGAVLCLFSKYNYFQWILNLPFENLVTHITIVRAAPNFLFLSHLEGNTVAPCSSKLLLLKVALINFSREQNRRKKNKCLGMNRCTTSKTCKLNLDSNMDLCDDILVLHNRDVGGGGGRGFWQII